MSLMGMACWTGDIEQWLLAKWETRGIMGVWSYIICRFKTNIWCHKRFRLILNRWLLLAVPSDLLGLVLLLCCRGLQDLLQAGM